MDTPPGSDADADVTGAGAGATWDDQVDMPPRGTNVREEVPGDWHDGPATPPFAAEQERFPTHDPSASRDQWREGGWRDERGYGQYPGGEMGGFESRRRGSARDASAGKGAWWGDVVPGAVGVAVSWVLGAVSSVSNATASVLAGVAPRGVPFATLRTLAYLLWGGLFVLAFQRLLAGVVLIGGLGLLAVGVAQTETSSGWTDGGRSDDAGSRRRTRQGSGDPRDGRRARGAVFGSRGENFDAFRDATARVKARRWREQFFGDLPTSAAGVMREFWNEPLAYERTSRAAAGGGPVDAAASGYGEGFPGEYPPDAFDAPKTKGQAVSESAPRTRDDTLSWNGFEHDDVPLRREGEGEFTGGAIGVDLGVTAEATFASAAAGAGPSNQTRGGEDEMAAVKEDTNPGQTSGAAASAGFGDILGGALASVAASFDGAGPAGEAGFSFEGMKRGKKKPGSITGTPVALGDPRDAVVDVEARTVTFDEWLGATPTSSESPASSSTTSTSTSTPSATSPAWADDGGGARDRSRGHPSAVNERNAPRNGTTTDAGMGSRYEQTVRDGGGGGDWRTPPRWTAATYRNGEGGRPSDRRGGYRDAEEARTGPPFNAPFISGFDGVNDVDPNGGFAGGFRHPDADFERRRPIGRPPAFGRVPSGAANTRWLREFMTGRFYGEYQEDMVSARFEDVSVGGVSGDREEGSGGEMRRGETSRSTEETSDGRSVGGEQAEARGDSAT